MYVEPSIGVIRGAHDVILELRKVIKNFPHDSEIAAICKSNIIEARKVIKWGLKYEPKFKHIPKKYLNR